MTVPAEDERCIYLTSKGNRCRNSRWSDQELCWFHHNWLDESKPEKATKIQIARMDLDNPEGIHRLLSETMERLVAGQIPARRATAIGFFGQVLLTSLDRLENYRGRRNFDTEWNKAKEKALTDLMLDAGIDVVDEEAPKPEDKDDETSAA
jgi:hypothetical protein